MVKLCLCFINCALFRESIRRNGGKAPPFLTSALDGSGGVKFTPRPLYHWERAQGTQSIGDCVGIRIGLETVDITLLFYILVSITSTNYFYPFYIYLRKKKLDLISFYVCFTEYHQSWNQLRHSL
jgi:hypothetical protein